MSKTYHFNITNTEQFQKIKDLILRKLKNYPFHLARGNDNKTITIIGYSKDDVCLHLPDNCEEIYKELKDSYFSIKRGNGTTLLEQLAYNKKIYGDSDQSYKRLKSFSIRRFVKTIKNLIDCTLRK